MNHIKRARRRHAVTAWVIAMEAYGFSQDA